MIPKKYQSCRHHQWCPPLTAPTIRYLKVGAEGTVGPTLKPIAAGQTLQRQSAIQSQHLPQLHDYVGMSPCYEGTEVITMIISRLSEAFPDLTIF